ncbi:MAG: flagellar basal body P-ring protein FlgI [Candidatus Sumerlaeota bacterium]|nr:flagellar basal body P-ring protein FlgI [Candidatus Sumerlaeota bacterium]
MLRKLHPFPLALALALAFAAPSFAVRIKDIATIEGVRDNQLQGLGLVVGLNGSGDSQTVDFTSQVVVNYLRQNNISIDVKGAQVKNAALVLVTANLPPFAKQGSHINATVSAIGDAKSLQGGTLLQTPLKAANGGIYAVAQGPMVIGGFAAQAGGAGVQQNHPTAGMVPNGAIVEQEVPFALTDAASLTWVLENPDHTTAARMDEVINSKFSSIAHAPDLASVRVIVPPDGYGDHLVDFISEVEKLPISPDVRARVVINERTGTIVMGEDVRISTVAIAKGNLTVETSTIYDVSQPQPFSQGQTVVVPQTGVAVAEQAANVGVVQGKTGNGGNVALMEEGVSIGEVVRALNAIGATPRDLIAILQAVKDAGALQAELVVQQ